ncbi:MAG: DUF3048 domain-containing protein [Actinomycetota bacterium]
MRGKSRRALMACAAAAALVAVSCNDDSSGPGPDASARVAGDKPAPEPKCLSGIEAPGGVDPARPAVALKIENSPSARPQSGLENADVVFEERVEGGITRFLAVYHCGDSSHAGPVRSARFDDPKIAKPLTRVLVASGSNAIVEREVRKQKMAYLDEQSVPHGALFRDPPGSTDIHSLFANTKRLRKPALAKNLGAPNQNIFRFGEVARKAKRARVVRIFFTESNTIEFRWKRGSWKRSEGGTRFVTARGVQIAVPNVLVQQVRVDDSKSIADSAGFPSPDIRLENSKGKAVLFRDGKAIRATWKMGAVGDAPVYKTVAGDPLLFARGPIWVELVPSPAGEVKGRFDFR